MSKWITYLVYAVIAIVAAAFLVWTVWPMIHKDVGKKTVQATNAIVTNQAVATNAAVEKKATNAAQTITKVEQRASTAAVRIRADRSGDPAAFNSWVDELCSYDIYKGYADCAGRGGQPASKLAR